MIKAGKLVKPATVSHVNKSGSEFAQNRFIQNIKL
jgi:hypothetical protein